MSKFFYLSYYGGLTDKDSKKESSSPIEGTIGWFYNDGVFYYGEGAFPYVNSSSSYCDSFNNYKLPYTIDGAEVYPSSEFSTRLLVTPKELTRDDFLAFTGQTEISATHYPLWIPTTTIPAGRYEITTQQTPSVHQPELWTQGTPSYSSSGSGFIHGTNIAGYSWSSGGLNLSTVAVPASGSVNGTKIAGIVSYSTGSYIGYFTSLTAVSSYTQIKIGDVLTLDEDVEAPAYLYDVLFSNSEVQPYTYTIASNSGETLATFETEKAIASIAVTETSGQKIITAALTNGGTVTYTYASTGTGTFSGYGITSGQVTPTITVDGGFFTFDGGTYSTLYEIYGQSTNLKISVLNNTGTKTLATISTDALSSTISLSTSGDTKTLTVTDENGTTATASWTSTAPAFYSEFLGLSFTALGGLSIASGCTVSLTLGGSVSLYEAWKRTAVTPSPEIVQPDNETGILLYNCTAEKNRLDKSSYLTAVYTMEGAFRGSVSLVSPTIRIAYTGEPSFNYCYVESLGRYYFVNDITIVRTGLLDLSLSVDPLMTYKEQIENLSGIIDRIGEIPADGSNLSDDRVYLGDQVNTETTNATEDNPFTYQQTGALDVDSIIIMIPSFSATASVSTLYPVSSQASAPYVMNLTNFLKFADLLLDNDFKTATSEFFDNAASAIQNIVACPFEVDSWSGITSALSHSLVIAGVTFSGVDGYYLPATFELKRLVGSFTVSRYFNTFLDYEPYTTIEIICPLLGAVKVDAKLVYDGTTSVYYVPDYMKNEFTVYIENSEHGIIYTGRCTLGYEIPLTSSNIANLRQQALVNTINTAMGVTTGIAKTAITGNPGGLISATGSLVSGITSKLTQGLSVSSGAGTGNFGDWYYNKTCALKITRPAYTYPDDYGTINGYPYGQAGTIGDQPSGLVEASQIHIEGLGTATSGEIEQVQQSLQTGVIL